MFVFGVDATRTPVEDVICMEAEQCRLDNDGAEDTFSSVPAEAVLDMKLVFAVKPWFVSALVVAVTTELLPELSINGGNGCKADC